ncbi:CBO0543 family protein [Paenibacillus rigui]|uniref:Uncharacterized protein n=1 Tax=Paenibacillus rigui TaxID=554312 RepID=A0A229UWR3_9BACL|nr:CBO0543 family protein [Paenibacillus rigui]OXM87701.1 hypothetical protein CF651_00850 [Paenibacillus rigui]
MVAVVYSVLWIISSFKLVHWRLWYTYYPTALYAAIGNLLYEVICDDYPLWQMEPNGLPNQTMPEILLIVIGMPLSTLVFLSHFPEQRFIKQLLYIIGFVLLFLVMEWISVHYGSITYHNGWNLYWSILFDLIMFPLLRIHYRNPLLCLCLSAVFVAFLSITFQLTLDKME